MKKMKKVISLLLAIAMVIGLMQTSLSVSAATRTADDCVKELIVYYKNYQENAATDIERLLAELKTLDEEKYEDWKEIMDYWSYINTEMPVNFGVAPDGLPEDDSLAIVVLGFALNSDGTMKDELIGRLQVGLASAEKYPNSYIVVTGGGTAANNPNVTEGGLMGEWLLEQGLDEDRLIVENAAPTTVGNALNTYNLLVNDYPQVESVCLITSDYHVPRGCLLFNSKFILAATEAGTKPLNIVANAGYVTGTNGYESVSLQASGVSQVADLSVSGVNVALSKVTSLVVTQEADYVSGEELNLNVVATYDTDYSRDVSAEVVVEGFDAQANADQVVTVNYTENGVTVSCEVVLKAGTTEVVVTEYLEALIEEKEAVDASVYSASSYQKLADQIQAAKDLLAGGVFTLAEIENAYDGIVGAYESLLKILNASSKKNVTANCNQAEAYKITDGSTSTYWTSKDSNGDVPIADSYFVIDLDGEYELDRIHVTPYNGNNRYYQYDVQISTDGENWETVVENRTTTAATSSGYVHEMEAGVYARYVKVVGVAVHRPDKNIINFHVKETAVYGVESDNLALGKPVVSSGTDTSAGSSANSNERIAVDGDRTTYWDGGAYSNRPFFTVALGDVYRIDDINVINYWSANNRYYNYEVHTSIDGENFVMVGEKTDDVYAGMYGETFTFEDDVYAAYVKVVGTYNSKNSAFHLNELRVHGEPAEEESYKEYEYNLAKKTLSDLIAEVEAAYVEGEYTEETWGALAAAIAHAQELLADDTTDLAEFYAAAASIRAAVEELTYLIFENPEGTVRLASTNLYAKGNTDIPAVFTYFYNRYSIDYAGLQEIDRNTSRNPYDMMEALTTNTRFVDFAFNKNMDFQGGEYGIGILSSTPIKEKSGGLYKVLGSEEPRGWVRSVIEIDGKEVAFYDTHLSTEDEACISNMKEIIKLMDEDPLEYVILTADFNCNREWMYPFLENYNMANGKDGNWYATSGDDYTDIASSESYGLDNIITSRNIEVVDFKVVDSMDLSDHNFIYIDLKLLDEEVPSKEYLKIEVADAKNLEEADYTAESYAVLAEALADAEALGDDAAQAEINEVLYAIQDAAANLERIYPLISAGKTVTVDGKVDSGSAANVNDGNRYSYMKTAYGNDVVMDLEGLYEIDEIQAFLYGKAPRYYHYTLYTSIDGVNYEVYGEKADNKIANIKVGDVYQKDDCMARYVIMDMTYNSAATGGHAYLSELDVFGAPAEGTEDYKAAVRQLIASYRDVDGEEYLPSTYLNLQETILEAEAVCDNADAALEEVTAAYDALLAAYKGLDKLADTTELRALIAEVQGMELEGYSARTVANLNEKLEVAEALCEDENATQSAVDEAIAKLETAIALLAAPVNAAYKMPLETAENTAMVTLDGVYNLDEIIVATEDGAAYKYRVLVSEDGETWTKAAEQTSEEASEEGYVHGIDHALKVKYIKVESDEALAVSSIYAYGEESNNIALGKPLTFGNSTTGKSPLVVNDGDRSNYWEAGKWASEPWVVIDLEGVYTLDRINVIPYWKTSGRIYQYDVYTSVDGENFTLFASKDSTSAVSVYGDTFEAEGEVQAAYIKVVGLHNSQNSVFHLNEVRAYGELVEVEEPEFNDVSNIFADVVHEAWYEAGVQFVYDNGIMSGSNGLFKPTEDITRAQFVTTLYRFAGSPEVTDKSALDDLADVNATGYYADAVCWAYAEGITTGSNGKFNPANKLTRQQMVAFLYRFAEVQGFDTEVRGDYSEMLNADKVSIYAETAMEWAVGAGLISGSDVTDSNGNKVSDLNPLGNTTRAQVATIIMRFCAE